MQLKCVFVTDKKQAVVPKGWKIDRVDVVAPDKGRPQFMILMSRGDEEVEKVKGEIGFRVHATPRRSKK